MAGLAFILLGLGNDIAGARNLPLIAVEDGNLHAEEQVSGIQSAHMGVLESAAQVAFAIGPRQFILTLRRSYALLRGAQVRAGLESACLQVFEAKLHRLILQLIC